MVSVVTAAFPELLEGLAIVSADHPFLIGQPEDVAGDFAYLLIVVELMFRIAPADDRHLGARALPRLAVDGVLEPVHHHDEADVGEAALDLVLDAGGVPVALLVLLAQQVP